MSEMIYQTSVVMMIALSFVFFQWLQTPRGQDFAIKIGRPLYHLLAKITKQDGK